MRHVAVENSHCSEQPCPPPHGLQTCARGRVPLPYTTLVIILALLFSVSLVCGSVLETSRSLNFARSRCPLRPPVFAATVGVAHIPARCAVVLVLERSAVEYACASEKLLYYCGETTLLSLPTRALRGTLPDSSPPSYASLAGKRGSLIFIILNGALSAAHAAGAMLSNPCPTAKVVLPHTSKYSTHGRKDTAALTAKVYRLPTAKGKPTQI